MVYIFKMPWWVINNQCSVRVVWLGCIFFLFFFCSNFINLFFFILSCYFLFSVCWVVLTFICAELVQFFAIFSLLICVLIGKSFGIFVLIDMLSILDVTHGILYLLRYYRLWLISIQSGLLKLLCHCLLFLFL